MRKLLSLFVAVLTALTITASAAAQSGSLDTTFGSGGLVLMEQPRNINQVDQAVHADGRIVALYHAYSSSGPYLNRIVRLNPDGSLDTSFDNDGIVNFYWNSISTDPSRAYSIAIQAVGGEERYVVSGVGRYATSSKNAVSGLKVGRFTASGAVDTSFAGGGSVVYNTGYALSLAIQPSDQKILTVSDVGKLVRLNANGTLDATFGSGGVVSRAAGKGIAVDPAGNILVGGSSQVGPRNQTRTVPNVTRYKANGSVDANFGLNGVAVGDHGIAVGGVLQVKLDPWSRIIVAGTSSPLTTAGNLAVMRFTENGIRDGSFGGGTGMVTADSGTPDYLHGMTIDSNGGVILSGKAGNNVTPERNFMLAKFDVYGASDTGFGTNGTVILNTSSGDEAYNGVSIQKDPACICDKLVMVGGAAANLVFARFHL